ncbi:P-loop NTPase fold protein [Pontiellaceae bacterium B12219]|nr:P-loop NTPase fold protein [Pontiellaceae bacterium B12219]
MPDKEHAFSADQPIKGKSEDVLNRARFSESIATAIRNWAGDDSLVLGLYGKWGSGKSSVKNMILESLEGEKPDSPKIIEFNPWQWSSQSQIAQAFFREIQIALEKSPTKDDKARAKHWRLYAAYLDFGAETANLMQKAIVLIFLLATGLMLSFRIVPPGWIKPIAYILATLFLGVSILCARANIVAEKLSKLLQARGEARQKSLEEIRGQLMKSMAQSGQLLIVIDDVDRLTPDELVLLFQLGRVNTTGACPR